MTFAHLIFAALLCTQAPPNAPDLSKGVLHGRVVDSAGKPVAGATVALQEKEGKVLAWAKTNEQGEYTLGADTLTALHLRPSRRRGLLEQVVRTVGDVALAPMKVAAGAVANPGRTAKNVAESAAAGSPVPLVKQAEGAVVPNKDAAKQTAEQAKEAAAKAALGDAPHSTPAENTADKGEAMLLVSAPQYKDAKVTAGAYWLEPAAAEGKPRTGLQAWLETVRLAATADKGNSDVQQEAVLLTDPVVTPTLIAPKAPITVQVKLSAPANFNHSIRIFAREQSTKTVVELKPGQDKSLYTAQLILPPNAKAGKTSLAVAALRAEPVDVKLNPKKADPLPEFVKRLEDLDPSKPYGFDPRIMASENRIDAAVTVLDPKKGH